MKFRIVEEIEKIPENYGIEKYKFRSDGTLDVFQNVDLENKNLEELPFKFGKIDGNFNFFANYIKNLNDAPEEVYGYFNCGGNNLTSLKGIPKIINGWFNCQNNKLTDLKYTPNKIDGDFYCCYNNLTSLKGVPKVIKGNFDCSRNNLKNLKGAPKIVNGDFNCEVNELTSLEGLNFDGITGKIYLWGNPDLKFNEKEQLWMILNPERYILK